MRARPIVVAVALLGLLLVASLVYSLLQDEPSAAPPPGAATPGPTEPTPSEPPTTEAPEADEPEAEPEPVVMLAAGDIATCSREREPHDTVQRTAALVEDLLAEEEREAMVAALGDLAEDGAEEDFEDCYHPTWGPWRDITRPALGNHDDNTDEGEAFFAYFEHVDMPSPEGWYAYELGAWHVFVLNTNCGEVGGCEEGDEQYEWLEEQLDDLETSNIVAYWHKPRFSVGRHGDFENIADAYELLADAGADLVMSGHDHAYARWAPQHADGTLDERAPRQFVVGTGGGGLRPVEDEDDLDVEGLEFHQDEEHGVLRLELEACAYAWEFITVDGDVLDEGRVEETCSDG